MVSGVDDSLSERRCAGASPLEPVVHLRSVRALLECQPAHELDLLVRVLGKAVDRHDGLEPESGHDREVPREVRRTGLDRVEAAVRIAAVVLECFRGRDEHDRARLQPADAAYDVEELLHAHVGSEAGLGHDVLT